MDLLKHMEAPAVLVTALCWTPGRDRLIPNICYESPPCSGTPFCS